MILPRLSRWLHADKVCICTSLATLLFLVPVPASSRMFAATDSTQAAPSPMTLDQVVDQLIARNRDRSRELKGYQGNRIYTVRYHGFPKDLNARMVVSMRYVAPNTKEFSVTSESGPKLLVDEVLKRLLKTEADAQKKNTREAVNLDRTNYVFSDLQYAQAADGCDYTLSVEPRKPNKYLYRGKIRVNEQDFAVCAIHAEPAVNPSFWIKSTVIHETYEKIGDFWLPKENKSESRIRFGGSATLTIQYQNYKLQTQPLANADPVSSSSSIGR